MNRIFSWGQRHIRGDVLETGLKFLRFALVGVLSGLIYFIVTHLCVRYGAVEPKLAALIGYCAAIPTNFVFNRRFSFRSTGAVAPELAKFLITHGAGMAVAWGMMALFVDRLGWSHLLPAAFTVFVVPLVNFVVLNLWVFARQAGRV
ncbi:MAG: GtrA family protein [Rhizobiaceae bacterium]|jgi:putative flippase GtrA|nr:GtrA family protein [Rhizobiaceae bacterium]